MDVTSLIWFLLIGLIAGWLAGQVMKGRGYGIVVDLIVGLIGAVVGGVLFGLVVSGEYGFWGTILVAFIGACILVAIVRFVARGRTAL